MELDEFHKIHWIYITIGCQSIETRIIKSRACRKRIVVKIKKDIQKLIITTISDLQHIIVFCLCFKRGTVQVCSRYWIINNKIQNFNILGQKGE